MQKFEQDFAFVSFNVHFGYVGLQRRHYKIPAWANPWGRLPPRPKSCEGDGFKSPPQEFCNDAVVHIAKMYIKNYECAIIKVKKVAPENATKAFGGRTPLGPAGGAYTVTSNLHLLNLMDRDRPRKGEGKRQEWRGQGLMGDRGRRGGREGREERQGEGQEGVRRGSDGEENLAPTAISKSRRLC